MGGCKCQGITDMLFNIKKRVQLPTLLPCYCEVFSCDTIFINIYFTLRKKCPYSELLWSVFSRIWTKYGEIRSLSPYSVRKREKAEQDNSEYGHFSRSAMCHHVHYLQKSLYQVRINPMGADFNESKTS